MTNAVEKFEPSAGAPAIVSETTAIVQMIERAAANPAVDIDKMMKLLEMRERVQAEEARKAFNAAMAVAQAEMPQVVRKAKNTQTNSKYATLEAVNDAIQPIITKHGFGLSFGTEECPHKDHYRVTCDVTHSGGGEKRYYADVPIDAAGIKGVVNKTATHAFGSTMSYGRRYLTLLIFNVATKDDDDGNKAGGMTEDNAITPQQCETLQRRIVEIGADLIGFQNFFKIERVADLPAREYQRAMNMLAQRERKMKEPV